MRFVFFLKPSLYRISLENLKRAFPERDDAWRKSIIKRNFTELGRLLADFVRLPSIDRAWLDKHVDYSAAARGIELIGQNKGIVLATGHLGSFELLGNIMPIMGSPLAVVARDFKLRRVDAWWTAMREKHGNSVIKRGGAFKKILRSLQNGQSIALLFDQNMTRDYAVFVDFFGEQAATTKALALSVIRGGSAFVSVASLRYDGNDHYTVLYSDRDFSELVSDDTIPLDEKILIITQWVSDEYAKMIKAFPEGWFWMHRRWKTRP